MSIYLRSYLSDSTPERRHKAQEAINSDQLAITIAHQDDSQIRALVKNSDHLEHGVTLTEHGGFCGCRDFSYRGVICYHQVGVAIYAMAHPTPVTEKIHLVWNDDTLLCGAIFHANMRTWKRWTLNALNWGDIVCLDCVKTWTDPRSMQEAA